FLEAFERHQLAIDASSILARLGLKAKAYFAATLHRAENVDSPMRLQRLLDGMTRAGEKFGRPVILAAHPRTAARLRQQAADTSSLRLIEPLGFFDFLALEQSAECVISDSGTVQEECTIFRIPNLTIRDVTERAETIECGSNILTGDAGPFDHRCSFRGSHRERSLPRPSARRFRTFRCSPCDFSRSRFCFSPRTCFCLQASSSWCGPACIVERSFHRSAFMWCPRSSP